MAVRAHIAALVFLVVSCSPENPEEQYKHLVDAYLAYFNTGDITGAEDILQPDFKIYFSPSFELALEGMDAYKEEIDRYHEVNSHLAVEEVVYGADAITVRWVITQQYPDSSGNMSVTVSGKGISLMHIRDGKLADEWIAYDTKAWMEQLGYEMVRKDSSPPGE